MFLDPKTGHEVELDVVRAVANAQLSVRDALETPGLMMGDPGGRGG